MLDRILRMPLMLILTGIGAAGMFLPAVFALVLGQHHTARTFFYSGVLALIIVGMIGIAQSNRTHREGHMRQLLALFYAFAVLPLILAVPFYESLGTISFLNAFVEMVNSVTTTGAPFFDDPGRLSPPLHLWRAQVAWMGGFLMWVAAVAILAPLNLGGFEVTAGGEPGQAARFSQIGERQNNAARRLERATFALLPVYLGLTCLLWFCLIVLGERGWVALCHAMSVMSTSGISPIGGIANGNSGIAGEMVIFLFLLFALSRITFSSDTSARSVRTQLHHDPEFRLGLLIVVAVPLILFARHWIGAFDPGSAVDWRAGLAALWGGLFTVLSFLTTTGFESADWAEAQGWSGLGTPGLILMGLALIGGGVATTAGGVKLLRVYALALNGHRELERLVHPNSVGRARAQGRRLRKQGAFAAFVFFMLFAVSFAVVTTLLTAMDTDFESAIVLAIATLTTTGPVIATASETPILLGTLTPAAKLVMCGAMVLGRLELLAIIALITSDPWRR